MTVQDVIDKYRLLIGDTVSPYRWSDPVAISKLNDAMEQLWKDQSTAFYLTTVVTTKPSDVGATSDTVPVRDDHRQALVYLMCYLTLIEDQDDQVNINLGNMYFDKYEKELV
jgi:hypothetical protein